MAMNINQLTQKLISAVLSLSLVLIPHLTTKVLADSNSVNGFEPAPGKDAPRGGTVGGGSRPVASACLANPSAKSATLTALSPSDRVGLTQSNRPNLFVNLPQTTAQTIEFSLFDEKMNGIYQTNILVSKSGGLVSIALPKDALSLAKDKPYYWTVALVCNSIDRTEDLVVGGWVEYTEPSDNLKQQLANATEIEKASLYAQQGFWYDAVNLLQGISQTEPNNPVLANNWRELLKSVGLEAITTAKLGN